MPDNEQQSKKYTLPNNGQGWEIGNVITADRMNAISNALAFTSEEIDNAVNGTIYDNENNNILARKLDGLIKCFTQNTYTNDDLKYTRFYTLPFTGDEMTYEVPTVDEFNTFTTQKNQEFNAFTNTINTAYNIFKQSFARPYSKDNRYERGTYVEYNGQIYKLLVPIPEKTTAQDNDAAWNSISNNNKQQITIMQELGGLINIYTDEEQLTQETNKIWINTQNNEVEVPTYEQFNDVKSVVDYLGKQNIQAITGWVIGGLNGGMNATNTSQNRIHIAKGSFPRIPSGCRIVAKIPNGFAWRVGIYGQQEYNPAPTIITGSGSSDYVAQDVVISSEYAGCYLNFNVKKTDDSDFTQEEIDALTGFALSIEGILGVVSDLHTTDQSTIVNAVNEVNDKTQMNTESLDLNMELLRHVESINLPYTITPGAYIAHASGASVSNSGSFGVTDYIDVSLFESILYSRTMHTVDNTSAGMAFYNDQKSRVSGFAGASKAEEFGYTLQYLPVPANAKYARFSAFINNDYGTFALSGVPKLTNVYNASDKIVKRNNLGFTNNAYYPYKYYPLTFGSKEIANIPLHQLYPVRPVFTSGMASDGERYLYISVRWEDHRPIAINKYDLVLNKYVASYNVDNIGHCQSMCYKDGELYVVSRIRGDTKLVSEGGTADLITVLDADTLETKRSFGMESIFGNNSEYSPAIGGIAWSSTFQCFISVTVASTKYPVRAVVLWDENGVKRYGDITAYDQICDGVTCDNSFIYALLSYKLAYITWDSLEVMLYNANKPLAEQETILETGLEAESVICTSDGFYVNANLTNTDSKLESARKLFKVYPKTFQFIT